jgi:hypothetical protein
MPPLFQIGAYKIDQVLTEIRRKRSMTVLQEMQPDMVFKHLGHQPIDTASHCRQQHQHFGTIMILCSKLSFHRFHLSSNPFHPVQQFCSPSVQM